MLLVVLEQPVRVRRQPEEVVVLADELDRPLVDRAEVPLEELGLRVVRLAVDAVQALVVAQVDVVAAVVVHGVEDLDHRVPVPRLGGAYVVVVGDVEPRPHRATSLELVDPLLAPTPFASAARCTFSPCRRSPPMEDVLAAEPVVARDHVVPTALYAVPIWGTSFA
jgi:hypothetical protein